MIVAGSTLVLLAYAAWRDLAVRILPDHVSVAIAVMGIAYHLQESAYNALWSFLAAIVLFLVMVPLFARNYLGGGDVKLLSAVVTGLHLSELWSFLVATILAGGLLAGGYIALGPTCRRGRSVLSLQPVLRVVAVERWRIGRRAPLPYGVAILLGWVIAILPNRLS